MASSYTSFGVEIMVTGENSGTWGSKTNTNLTLIEQAIGGYEEVSIAGGAQTTALALSNAALSNGRNAVIKFTGTITGNQIVTVPDSLEKTYTLLNGTTGAFTVQVKTVSGTGITFSATDKGYKTVFVDGTNVVETEIGTAGIADDAVTNAKILNPSITINGVAANLGSSVTIAAGTDWQAVKTTTFTAVAGEGYFVNTNGGTFTATLPGSPSLGDEISFIDYAGTFDTNNLTIGRNGNPIQGTAADLTVATERAGFTLVFVDGTQGWLLANN